jgi:hypothetical protein
MSLLYRTLLSVVPQQCHLVLHQPYADIDPSFLGMVETYEALSHLIPKHWTVLDIGCSYAPQAYYFREHKRYIGVNLPQRPRLQTFCFANSEFVWMRGEDFINSKHALMLQLNLEQTFAICNYVPDSNDVLGKAVRGTFKNLYCFYPSGTPPGDYG